MIRHTPYNTTNYRNTEFGIVIVEREIIRVVTMGIVVINVRNKIKNVKKRVFYPKNKKKRL